MTPQIPEQTAKEFFTPMRKGAKKTNKSESWFSFLNLSGFAPLREVSGQD